MGARCAVGSTPVGLGGLAFSQGYWRFFYAIARAACKILYLKQSSYDSKKKRKKEEEKAKKVKELHPPSPLHTRRLKSQHHEIITTFHFSTPPYEFALGGGVIPPLHSPSLRFTPLGFLHSGLMDFLFCDDVSSPYPAFALPRLEHLHGRQNSSQRLCYKRPGTRFAVRENISTGHGRFPCSLFL